MKQEQATASSLTALLAFVPVGATHFKVTPDGKKRSTYEEIIEMKALHDKDDFTVICQESCEVIPAKKEGSKWVDMAWVNAPTKKPAAKKAPAKKDEAKKAPTKKAAKAKPEAKKPAAKKAPKEKVERVNTGFVPMIRELLNAGNKTIQQAADAILAKFPDKDVRSVKRICYNIARREGKGWKTSAVNTGYLNRIDELLDLGENTTRQIGEIVSVEFEKELASAKAVVRARLQVRLGMGHKLKVPNEDTESRQITYLPQEEV